MTTPTSTKMTFAVASATPTKLSSPISALCSVPRSPRRILNLQPHTPKQPLHAPSPHSPPAQHPNPPILPLLHTQTQMIHHSPFTIHKWHLRRTIQSSRRAKVKRRRSHRAKGSRRRTCRAKVQRRRNNPLRAQNAPVASIHSRPCSRAGVVRTTIANIAASPSALPTFQSSTVPAAESCFPSFLLMENGLSRSEERRVGEQCRSTS